MEYFVRILCVIVLAIILSLTTCQNIATTPLIKQEDEDKGFSAHITRLERKYNLLPIQFANVITFLLFLHLMLIISNKFLVKICL